MAAGCGGYRRTCEYDLSNSLRGAIRIATSGSPGELLLRRRYVANQELQESFCTYSPRPTSRVVVFRDIPVDIVQTAVAYLNVDLAVKERGDILHEGGYNASPGAPLQLLGSGNMNIILLMF